MTYKIKIIWSVFHKWKKLEWKIDTFSAFFADSIMMSNINPGSLNSTNVLIFVVSHVWIENIVATKRLFLTKLKWKRQNSRLNNQRHYKNLVVAWGRDSSTDFINGLFQRFQCVISYLKWYAFCLLFHDIGITTKRIFK